MTKWLVVKNKTVKCCSPFVSFCWKKKLHMEHLSGLKLPPQCSLLHCHHPRQKWVVTVTTPQAGCPWPPPSSSGSRPTGWTAWTAGTSANQISGVSGWSFLLSAVYLMKRSQWDKSNVNFSQISHSGWWTQNFNRWQVYQAKTFQSRKETKLVHCKIDYSSIYVSLFCLSPKR